MNTKSSHTADGRHDETILQMRGINKRFGGVRALVDVDFDVRRGEVHALVGGNGAGKSTLIRVLTGAIAADRGSMVFDGQPFRPGAPADAVRHGIRSIYQEIGLVGSLTVAENLLLGRMPRRWYGIDWRAARRRAAELLETFNLSLDVTRPLGSFPLGVQQMVAVARAVGADARLLVMDEPTSSLDHRETERFFQIVERLRRRRISIIFVTHFLDQVYRMSDRITILRNGRRSGVFQAKSLSRAHLVAHMLGRDAERDEPATTVRATADRRRQPTSDQPPLLSVRRIRRNGALEPVDLDAFAGQVLGIAGLLGAGRTELMRLLFGADRADGGTIRIAGRLSKIKSPRHAIRQGLALTPEDRQADGLIPELSVRENIVLAVQRSISRFGIVSRARQREIAREQIGRLGIGVADIEQPVGQLSGGNQQKVILARWLACRPRILILDEPTRGIDIGAKGEIERLIGELCTQGIAIIFVSAELDELARLCDRVLVLRDRRPICEISAPLITEQAIMAAIAGGGSND